MFQLNTLDFDKENPVKNAVFVYDIPLASSVEYEGEEFVNSEVLRILLKMMKLGAASLESSHLWG